jgi:[ribosomal protein S5]-alanine N-acetyltransferase
MLRVMVAAAEFQTPRLTGRRLTPDSARLQWQLFTDPGTMRTLSIDGGTASDDQIREICTRHLQHWAEHQFGMWQIFEAATHDFVGNCGLRHYSLQGAPEIELFFALRSAYFRRGYATEMAAAVIDMGFEQIGAASIVSFTMAHNVGSRRVMMKLGMQYEGVIQHAGHPHVLYRLKRSGRQRAADRLPGV